MLLQVHVLMLGTPELDTVLQVSSHEIRVEGQNPLTQPAVCAPFDAGQHTVGFWVTVSFEAFEQRPLKALKSFSVLVPELSVLKTW